MSKSQRSNLVGLIVFSALYVAAVANQLPAVFQLLDASGAVVFGILFVREG